jgi:tryptophan synthase alpha chain
MSGARAMESAFFAGRQPGTTGLVTFLNAGDPPMDVLEDLVLLFDAVGVDCLELAVPFPNSVSDGPVIRRSAERALDRGIGLGEVVCFLNRIRPRLRRLRVALLADWGHTVRPLRLDRFLSRVSASGADALLIHGLPPVLRGPYYEAAGAARLPVVTTCYASSATGVLEDAARHASAYLYLVAQHGRTGATPAQGYQGLAPVIRTLRGLGGAPVAVGFGVKSKAHLDELREAGADAAVVGSALVACLEQGLAEGRNPVAAAEAFLTELRGVRAPPAPACRGPPPPSVAP